MKTTNNIKQYRTIIKVLLIVITSSLVIYFCLQNYQFFLNLFQKINSILQPIYFGIVIAYLLTPICNKFEELLYNYYKKNDKTPTEREKKFIHFFTIFVSLIIFILVILLFFVIIIPQLISSISNFISHYPSYYSEVMNFVRGVLSSYPNQAYLTEVSRTAIEAVNDFFSDQILPNISSYINSFSSGVYSAAVTFFNFIIGLIVAVYCLDRRKIFALQATKIIYAFFSEPIANKILQTSRQANNIFVNFIVGKIIDSFIIGIICFVGNYLLGIPYPSLVAVIIGVTNIIPFFGPFLGAIPCLIIIVLESPIKALYFLIFIVLLQQFDGNILGPKILGDRTGISSFWVLFSILLFGGLWGVFGMIIAVPLFVVLYNLFKEYVNERLTEKHLPTETNQYSEENLKKVEEQK